MDVLSRGHRTARGGIMDIRLIAFAGNIEKYLQSLDFA